MKQPFTVRLKIVANMCDNISYLEVRDGRVSYLTPSGMPLALSNIAGGNATELQWRLEDARTEADAVAAARKYMQYAKKVEVFI